MSFFKGIGMPKEAEQPEVVEKTDRPIMKEFDILHGYSDVTANEITDGDMSDVLNSIFKKFGLVAETGSEKETDTNTSLESKNYSEYLEKGEDDKYYDKETGKAYDSIEAWKKAQETLAKRYESIAQYYEDKAKKEWARFKNSEQNGESGAEKWEHYRRSQEYYAKVKECKEKAAYLREKFGQDEKNANDTISSIEAALINTSDAGKTAEVDTEREADDVLEKGNLIQNKIDGLQREAEVRDELEEKYPPEDGYAIISEAYLRDKDGNIVKDSVTGEGRRVDFVVVKDGKVVDSIEVTSKTADKTEQSAKEERIRDAGGNYIRDNDGNLVEIPSTVHTRIERRE